MSSNHWECPGYRFLLSQNDNLAHKHAFDDLTDKGNPDCELLIFKSAICSPLCLLTSLTSASPHIFTGRIDSWPPVLNYSSDSVAKNAHAIL
jgi:hypothetical protein